MMVPHTRQTDSQVPKPWGWRRNRRRTLLIRPAFQWRYAITIAFAVFVASSFAATMLYAVLHHEARLRAMHPETYVGNAPLIVFSGALALGGLSALGCGLWSVIVTHRVCGPLHVVGVFLTELAGNRLPKLRPLRRKDQFKDFYAVFCAAIGCLRESRKAQLKMLTEAIESAERAAAGDEAMCRQGLHAISALMQQLRAEAASALGKEWGDGEPSFPVHPIRTSQAPPALVP